MLRLMRVACSVVLLACVLATPSMAQPMDKRTLFTFSGPVTMPGVTLPAGEYLFRLANPDSGSTVVQVLSADGRKPYGLFFSMAAERLEPASTPEVRFMETAAGMPAAINTWWYPGDRRGYEFVYPKDQARRLTEGTGQPVLTTQSQSSTTEETHTSALARVSAGGDETKVRADATPSAMTPSGTSQHGVLAPSTTLIANATLLASVDPPITAGERPTQRRNEAQRQETQPAADRSPLASLAETARTPAEHIAVSKQYRSQAERFERQAEQHEAEARKLEGTPTPLVQKWPAMHRRPGSKERQLAMEARGAAKESRDAASGHLQLSVEALAASADQRPSQPSVD